MNCGLIEHFHEGLQGRIGTTSFSQNQFCGFDCNCSCEMISLFNAPSTPIRINQAVDSRTVNRCRLSLASAAGAANPKFFEGMEMEHCKAGGCNEVPHPLYCVPVPVLSA
jgi:hypothetical protein